MNQELFNIVGNIVWCADEVASIEANVAAQLQLIENPVEGSGTPWAA